MSLIKSRATRPGSLCADYFALACQAHRRNTQTTEIVLQSTRWQHPGNSHHNMNNTTYATFHLTSAKIFALHCHHTRWCTCPTHQYHDACQAPQPPSTKALAVVPLSTIWILHMKFPLSLLPFFLRQCLLAQLAYSFCKRCSNLSNYTLAKTF